MAVTIPRNTPKSRLVPETVAEAAEAQQSAERAYARTVERWQKARRDGAPDAEVVLAWCEQLRAYLALCDARADLVRAKI